MWLAPAGHVNPHGPSFHEILVNSRLRTFAQCLHWTCQSERDRYDLDLRNVKLRPQEKEKKKADILSGTFYIAFYRTLEKCQTIASVASVATWFFFLFCFFFDDGEQFKPLTGEETPETLNNRLTPS